SCEGARGVLRAARPPDRPGLLLPRGADPEGRDRAAVPVHAGVPCAADVQARRVEPAGRHPDHWKPRRGPDRGCSRVIELTITSNSAPAPGDIRLLKSGDRVVLSPCVYERADWPSILSALTTATGRGADIVWREN